MKILITGGDGFIAKELIDYFKRDGEHNIIAMNRYELPLLDEQKVNQWFEWNAKKIDVVIHTAVVGGNRLKEDGADVFFENITMFSNILKNVKKHNLLFFNFTSGAEDAHNCSMKNPYGLSKSIITKIINTYEKNIINLKIWNCFGKHGKQTRFIENNINNYINNKNIVIHQDKYFDFFYSEDVYKIVCHFIEKYKKGDINVEKVSCVYKEKTLLSEVAGIINNLSDKKVNIKLNNDGLDVEYCTRLLSFVIGKINLIGLNEGIRRIYDEWKKT